MKIGIDARFWGLEHAGIGRYVIELINSLARLDRKSNYTLFIRKKHRYSFNLPKNFSTVSADINHYTLEEQWLLSEIFTKQELDLLHVPHFNVPILYKRAFIVTIHDLLWHDVQGLSVTTLNPLTYLVKYLGYKATVSHALRKARAILVPSQQIKNKLVKDHHVSQNKIAITYEAPSQVFYKGKKDKSLLQKYGLTKPFIIYTGSAYPHKNIPAAGKAVKILNDRGTKLTLAVASARSVFLNKLRRQLKKDKADKSTVFLGFIPDEKLASLYQQALALVQPSISEGFGLTGLEAMAAGLPVIASNLSVFKEIYGDQALYADPESPQDIANKITKLLTTKNLRADLSSQGKKQAAKYSWQKLSQQTLAVYKKVLKSSRSS